MYCHPLLYIILCYPPLRLSRSGSVINRKEENMARFRRLRRRRLRMRTGARRLYRNRRSYRY